MKEVIYVKSISWRWTLHIFFFKEIQVLEENKELENSLRNIQLPKVEIKKLKDGGLSKKS